MIYKILVITWSASLAPTVTVLEYDAAFPATQAYQLLVNEIDEMPASEIQIKVIKLF